MSWSILVVGLVPAVSAAVAKQLASVRENVKHIPAEVESVKAAEALINVHLEFMGQEEGQAVSVSANGSAWSTPDRKQLSVNVEVKPIYGFVS